MRISATELLDQLGEQEKFIMVYAIAEEDRTAAEGEWYLNTAATSRDDNDFSETIVDELSKAYCIDEDRLYAIGYSLVSMYTYDIACQLNHRFAAVTSFAGTMPVDPKSCNLSGSVAYCISMVNWITSLITMKTGIGKKEKWKELNNEQHTWND